MKYGLHGKLTATEGNQGYLANLLLEASQLVSKAKGCRLYMISLDPNDMASVWVTEAWDSKEDHQNSLNTEEVKDLIVRATPLLALSPEKGQELGILGGVGVD